MYDDCPEEKKRTIEASMILEEILQNRPVTYDCVVVKGDLNFDIIPNYRIQYTEIKTEGGDENEIVEGNTNCNLAIVRPPITITNSVIQGKTSFVAVLFMDKLDFRGTTFAGKTSFKGSFFRQRSEFEGAHFQQETEFSGLILVHHNIRSASHFRRGANFKNTVFEKYAGFENVVFYKSADFSSQNRQESLSSRSIFKGHTNFIGTEFKGIAHFEACEFLDAKFGAEFRYANFKKEAYFQGALFSGHATFLNTTFEEYTDFSKAKFTSKENGVGFAEAIFNGYVTDFRNVIFNGTFANFRAAQFTGEFVSFRNAKFRNITDQERACRKAKKQLNSSGNRNEEDYMFFAEMDARRRQNGITKTPYPESSKRVEWGAMSIYEFIDYAKSAIINHEWLKIVGFFLYNLIGNFIFRYLFGGYGIFWYRIGFWWILISGLLGIYYWISQGIVGAPCLWQCIYFSFLVAFTKGYGDLYPKPEFELLVAGETVFGLLMFGIFIASITRKYMR